MSKTINFCFLQGHVGADPEIRALNDVNVAQFNLATSTGGFKKRDGTDVPEETQWHRVVAWRGLADVCRYIHKGDKVTVMGMIKYRNYEKYGKQMLAVDIVASDIVLGQQTQMAQTASPFPSSPQPYQQQPNQLPPQNQQPYQQPPQYQQPYQQPLPQQGQNPFPPQGNTDDYPF